MEKKKGSARSATKGIKISLKHHIIFVNYSTIAVIAFCVMTFLIMYLHEVIL